MEVIQDKCNSIEKMAFGRQGDQYNLGERAGADDDTM